MKQLIILMLASLLGACRVYPENWVPQEIPTCSATRLWDVSRLSMEKNGFPIVHKGFDPKTSQALSGWDFDLHPFKSHGIRERAHIRFKRADKPGKLLIDVRVEAESNENLARPLDLSAAKWVTAPDNVERARVVMQYIRSLLGSRLEIGKTLSKDEIELRAQRDALN